MSEIGSYEAKTHLPALLKRVEAGETLTITRHGKPIARLTPVRERPPLDKNEIIEGFRRIREQSGGATKEEIRAWIEEGRG